MARYIGEDEFIRWVKEHWCADCQNDDGLRCRACWIDDAIDLVEEAPEADVAPKSEVARLEQDVTRLVQENEDLKDSNEHLAVMLEETKIELEAMRGAANSYKMHYENLAREIFEEIEEARERWEVIYSPDHFGYGGSAYGYLETDVDHTIAELKKKYTEGKV